MKSWALKWIKVFSVGGAICVPLILLSELVFFGAASVGHHMEPRDWFYYFQGMCIYIVLSEVLGHYNSKENNQ